MKIKLPTLSKTDAFTLVELMIASALALLILGGIFTGLSQHQKTFNKKNHEQELQQNVRSAMMFVQRDLRYAGSGLTMGFTDLDTWFGLPSAVNDIPYIINNGDGRDEVIIAGITGEPVAELSVQANEGDSTLQLNILASNILPYTPVVGDVLLMQGIEAVMVTQVNSSTEIQVSRDPSTLSTGLHLIYPSGSQIFQINVIKYWVSDLDGVPTLLREDSRFSYESDADRVIADGIETFDLTRSGDEVTIQIEGRSREAVAGLTEDAIGDSMVRYELSSSNRLRNTDPYLSIQGWPSDIIGTASSSNPTPVPSEPTAEPSVEPTSEPVVEPTSEPVVEPTSEPVVAPTSEPVEEPTSEPVVEPTAISPTATPDYAGNSGNIKRPKKEK